MGNVVTLLTDFGTEDSYVSEVKAVLLSAGASVRMVDITHSIPPFDVNRGAFQLFRSYGYFPKDTIHLAVVDPGVGTKRRSIYVRTRKYHFVGPDNGLLSWAVDDCERREGKKANYYEIPSDKSLSSHTFHGRDLFAPFVVKLLKDRKPRLKKLARIKGDGFPMCRELDGVQRGHVISQDHFGNIITNIPHGNAKRAELQINHRQEKLKSVENYLSIEEGKFAIIRGSHGFWEIACAKNSAWDHLKVNVGDDLTLFPA
ncbi:MAG: SAM-dependent chlorinase/fluorinase [Bdellovibrionales bacterium]|nr:SAM-dependent chlorinase/fluorinase [Bdellovibrionales bacterium]